MVSVTAIAGRNLRDQDMASVDVASPGVWERASDVLFEELMERELQDEANGVVVVDDSSRPKAIGGCLTEQNLLKRRELHSRHLLALILK
jgi:hypothetical protein